MYTPSERAIFTYSDGNKTWHVDPLRVYRRLVTALGGDQNEVLKQARNDDVRIAFPAKEKLSDAARKAFDLEPFDVTTGQGCLDTDAEGILYDFLTWLEKKNQSTPIAPISYPLMESEPSWVKEILPMNNTLASGSISDGNNVVEPGS
jgi:hypothetical protein